MANDLEDEDFWDSELQNSDNDQADDIGSEASASSSRPSSSAAGAVQSSITQFFGASTRSRVRGEPTPTRTSNATPASRRPSAGRGRGRGQASAPQPEAESQLVVDTADPEVAGLTSEEKTKVYSSTSLMWLYFSKTARDQAKCNSCDEPVKTPTGATTLLQRHLQRKHMKEFSEFKKLQAIKKKIASRKASEKCKSRSGFVRVVQFPLDSKGKRAKVTTKAIALFMAKGLKPYSVVEELGFQHLVYVLEPRYVIPSRTQFSRSIIPSLYEDEKRKLQMRLFELGDKDCLESISLTTDAWSSRKMDSFLAFTVQFVNPEWRMEKHTLDLDPFPGAHTADVICEKMDDKIVEYNLHSENTKKYVTSDNGSNMLAALEQPSEQRMLDLEIAQILRLKKAWEHLKCFNHTSQLAINDTKRDMNANNVIEKLSKLVHRYSKSRTALESLEKFQKELGLPQHTLLQRVKTRWNSDFIMMERAVEQKQAIVAECTAAGEDHLTTQEWKLAEGFVEVLRPLSEHTDEMGSEKKPTGSMILPTIFEITSDLQDFIKNAPRGTGIQFARQCLSHLEKRFEYYKENQTLRIATLIDPRYKNILEGNLVYPAADKLLEELAEEKYRSKSEGGWWKWSRAKQQETPHPPFLIRRQPRKENGNTFNRKVWSAVPVVSLRRIV